MSPRQKLIGNQYSITRVCPFDATAWVRIQFLNQLSQIKTACDTLEAPLKPVFHASGKHWFWAPRAVFAAVPDRWSYDGKYGFIVKRTKFVI
jgi:hypothetical protein